MKTNSLFARNLAVGSTLLLLFFSSGQVARAADSIATLFPIEYQNQDYRGSLSDRSVGSGIAFWPGPKTYLLLDNQNDGTGLPRIVEYTRSHALVRTITLTDFTDPEDIHWISGNTFVISQEYRDSGASKDELVVIQIEPGTSDISLDVDNADRRLQINTSTLQSDHNEGIEAVAHIGGYFYFTTETVPDLPTSWKLWKVQNTGTGVSTVTPTEVFTFSSSIPDIAADFSGMATEGTYLWLLSHEGDPTSTGRLLKFTTSGTLLADYLLPAFTSPSGTWQQAEGLEFYIDPDDNMMRILITGERGTGSGVDFMRLAAPTITITATDALAGEPDPGTTYPGQFTVTRTAPNTTASLTVNFSTSASSAASGYDYTSISTTVTIDAGQANKVINVTPLDDSFLEADETVVVTLLPGTPYFVNTAGNNVATVTIQSVFELAGATQIYGVNGNGHAITDAGRHNGDGTLAQTYTFAAYGINDSGNVAGSGYARIGSTTYSLGTLDGYATTALRINSQNNIAGYANNGWSCYWLYTGSGFSGPYAHADGWLCDINDDNIIVGGYPGSIAHPSCYSLFQLPQPISGGQFPQSINAGGKIVGWETDGSTLRDIGVLYHPNYSGCDSGSYTVLDYLPDGANGDESIYPMDINASDVVVGYVGTSATILNYYSGGQWYYLNNIIGDATWTFGSAVGISDAGHIVGSGVHNGNGRCFLIRQ